MSAGRLAPSESERPWLPAVVAMFCCGWGGNQFTPLLLMYRRLGGYSEVTVDAFLAAYVVGLVPGLLVAGSASDRYGRKPLMLAGTVASVLASAVLAAGATGQVPLYAGRLLTGIAVGIAMAVGTSWVKELSQAPYSTESDPGAAARRASLSLTVGFGAGAGVAGALAQWGPWPMVTPYVVHVLVTLPALGWLVKVPETRARVAATASLWADLRVPEAGHPRFTRVVVPLAPWVFGAAGVAYAVMPQLVADRVGEWGLAYATLLTVLTLGTGALVQPLAKRLGARSTSRAILTAMALMAVGMGVCAANASLRSPWAGLGGAVLLGAAYGIAVVSGLLEIQRIASPEALAGLTGVYYALTYCGFLAPTVLAALAPVLSYTVMLGALSVLALACLVLIACGLRSRATALPRPERSTGGVVAQGGGAGSGAAEEASAARTGAAHR
ncbi:MFS transporter [Streptomyces daliensis]|uniref:MFS transporter n=1 Tax=Streptomyces daliensis TaxID=299421 RepID=A0A8T4IRR1_9ACTN|nr:MFS transporter [Streptomyces daliensis]